MAEVGGQQGQSSFGILTGPIPLHEGLCRESVSQMPHAAFEAECRGQENAEPQSEDLSEDIGRQGFDDVVRILRLGIIFRCSAAASIGRLKTRVAYRLVGTEPASRSVVWFWQALPPSARGGRANKFGLYRHFRDLTRAQ